MTRPHSGYFKKAKNNNGFQRDEAPLVGVLGAETAQESIYFLTRSEKEIRAEDIAKILGDNKVWHSHGRMKGIRHFVHSRFFF